MDTAVLVILCIIFVFGIVMIVDGALPRGEGTRRAEEWRDEQIGRRPRHE